MTITQAQQISESYGLKCDYSHGQHAFHIHFLDHGFYLAKDRTKLNKKFPLLEAVSAKDFRKLCVYYRPKAPTPAAQKFFETALSFDKYVSRKTIGIPGVRWYPEFNLLTIMCDGFPQARFVASKDFKSIFFAYSSNPKLEYAAEPKSIPHIFPATEFKKWLGHIAI